MAYKFTILTDTVQFKLRNERFYFTVINKSINELLHRSYSNLTLLRVNWTYIPSLVFNNAVFNYCALLFIFRKNKIK